MSNKLPSRTSSSPNPLAESLRRKMLSALSPNSATATGGDVYPDDVCLLLDVSGSMDELVGGSVRTRRIDALRKLMTDNFPMASKPGGLRVFEFSWECEELHNSPASEPSGGTNMGLAFETLKNHHIKSTVIITDGRPDSEERALMSAKGLKIDAFYVGPDPVPGFLRDLCAQTGGTFGRASLQATKELAQSVKERLLINAPSSEGKGPIIL